MSSELFTVCLWVGWWQSQYISAMSETQGGGLSREQFPPNTTPARAREPAPSRWKQNYREWSTTSELLLFNVKFLLLMFAKRV